jgi:O-Antigen ligase
VTASTIARVGRGSLSRERGSWTSAAVLLVPSITLIGVAAASGGFNATSFGWTALAFAWLAIVALTVVTPAWGALDVAWLTAATAVCLDTFGSAAWSGSVATAIDNGQRSLEYLLGITVALLVVRRGRLSLWLSGLVLGVGAVSVYSLATRLFPDHFGAFNGAAGYRLFVPIGYWNALGIFAAAAALIAFGVAVAGRGRVLRVLTAVAIVPLTATLYFTFSRGAWVALACGLLAVFALSAQRLRLLGGAFMLVPVPAVGVLLASRVSALTHQSIAVSAAAHAGHRLALEFALLTAAQAAVAAVYVVWLSRIRVGERTRRVAGAVVVAVVLGALIAAFTAYGSPPTLARHAYGSFVSTPAGGSDLNGRLFTLSNDGRIVLWRSALHDFEAHPVVGSGAGSFGRWWLAHRPSAYFVEDAHNLYMQTLAEGGVIGLVLLAALLGIPLIAAVRARKHPLVAPVFGAYAAFLVHAAVDWDWQMPAVTLLALFAGAALVAAARGNEPTIVLGRQSRFVIGAAATFAAAVAFVGLIGNIALANATSGVLNGTGRKAVSEAAKARRWAPWSAVALRELGETRAVTGQRQAGLVALRQAAAKDPGDWQTWFDIAVVTTGPERRAAVARVKSLNPYAPELVDLEKTR